MINSLYIMNLSSFEQVYAQADRDRLIQASHVLRAPMDTLDVYKHKEALEQVDVIFSGWGGPTLDEQFLQATPKLKAFFYAAGSLRTIVTEAAWERGIRFSSANAVNAIPVAEYTLSQILFALKQGWPMIRRVKEYQSFPAKPYREIAGAYGSTVGIISLSKVGKLVCERLKTFDVNVQVYDPYATDEQIAAAGATRATLAAIFAESDVVSLHAPLLEETKGMVHGNHFQSMKANASFINTARGEIIRQQDLVRVFGERRDLTAVLDVTDPEPPLRNDPLWKLNNVIVTPHIAGSEERECERMGALMVEEYLRYQAGVPLEHEVTRAQSQIQA
ncbi:hydroxyacid dehydrogenase [Geomicrobium sp. JCM 19039]|uniref:hydroxyacid dehydrogenase n=1 Tax=Geomicrobium sp. JCM 19039 TaxID=1460636 RepID=UPI00045F2ED1|nr:hydroxyacid dehydrogenase [Geomicrobium sp. JCM 19039]GAK10514.1 D-3-phosphoglycerate dehydrogenase [Geomicrobium sp. JCM 19039]